MSKGAMIAISLVFIVLPVILVLVEFAQSDDVPSMTRNQKFLFYGLAMAFPVLGGVLMYRTLKSTSAKQPLLLRGPKLTDEQRNVAALVLIVGFVQGFIIILSEQTGPVLRRFLLVDLYGILQGVVVSGIAFVLYWVQHRSRPPRFYWLVLAFALSGMGGHCVRGVLVGVVSLHSLAGFPVMLGALLGVLIILGPSTILSMYMLMGYIKQHKGTFGTLLISALIGFGGLLLAVALLAVVSPMFRNWIDKLLL